MLRAEMQVQKSKLQETLVKRDTINTECDLITDEIHTLVKHKINERKEFELHDFEI